MAFDAREQDRIQAIECFLMALRCVYDKKSRMKKIGIEIRYASSPITTGWRMCELFRKHNVKSVEGLKEIDANLMLNEVIKPNVQDGLLFRDRLKATLNTEYVFSPVGFKGEDWSQGHYMALWERVLIENMHIICLNDGWWFSNGCVEEFLIALTHRLKIVCSDGVSVLDPQKGAGLVLGAIKAQERWGLDSSKLVDLYRRIHLHINGRRHH
jgi:hypothetical protein